MADGTKLQLTFRDATAATRKWNFSNADNSVTRQEVKALMQGMITNGSIYKYPPVTAVSAHLVTTSTEPINITD